RDRQSWRLRQRAHPRRRGRRLPHAIGHRARGARDRPRGPPGGDLPRLEDSVRAMRHAAERGDGTGVSDADQQFHEVLVESSGSPRLIRAMRTLLVETRMCLGELETTYPDLGAQVREHEELREAIRAEPPARAEELLLAHLDDAVER